MLLVPKPAPTLIPLFWMQAGHERWEEPVSTPSKITNNRPQVTAVTTDRSWSIDPNYTTADRSCSVDPLDPYHPNSNSYSDVDSSLTTGFALLGCLYGFGCLQIGVSMLGCLWDWGI